jgi:hypothetical protein
MQKKTIKIPLYVLTTLEKTEHYNKETNNNLLTMHQNIADALEADKATPEAQAKPYGVMQNADFQEQAIAIELELEKRGAKFTKIYWP